MKHLVLGTAGHIDHGKTALVQALTGTNTDRLPEEKQRGITIDLGFANLVIGDVSLSVVDVPGHEDFIRNMVAGASGMDAVLLVIAADEGVMPQTREHLAILELLGVRAAVVAVTKADLVDEEWLPLVLDDVRDTLATTAFAQSPLVPVSARTGQGLDALREAILDAVAGGAKRAGADLFRMPVDRVFSVRGTGTVVTGTVWSGRIGVDQVVRLEPAGVSARVRGLQAHGEPVSSLGPGERGAVALAGVDREQLRRGDVVMNAAAWQPSTMLTARVQVLPGQEWPIEQRQRVRLHIGTADVLARAVVLEGELLAPGAIGWVQLRLEEPVIARTGDRFVLRSYSPVETIGGGVVVEVQPPKRSRLDDAAREVLERLCTGDVTAVVESAGEQGVELTLLPIVTGRPPTELENLPDDVVRIGDRAFAAATVEATGRRTLEAADALHAAQPLRPAFERAELRSRLPARLADFVLDQALRAGELEAVGSGLRRRGFAPRLTPKQTGLLETLRETLTAAGLAAPLVGELVQAHGPDVVPLLRLLEGEGMAVQVGQDLYLDLAAVMAARQRLAAELAGQPPLGASDFRQVLPVTRKHLIPLLEYFDRTGVTRRDGDLRTVLPASEAD